MSSKTTKTAEEKRAAKTAAQKARRASQRAQGSQPEKKAAPAKKATAKPAVAATAANDGPRDPRLPAPGTKHERVYKGKTLVLEALADGTFRFDGEIFKSVSGAAKKASGAKTVDGFLWWRLNPNGQRVGGGKSGSGRKPSGKKSKKGADKDGTPEPKIGNGNEIGTAEGQRKALEELGITKPRAHPTVEDAMAADRAEAAADGCEWAKNDRSDCSMQA